MSKLPHEGHIPTLPGKSNTGERYIYYYSKDQNHGSQYLVGGTGTAGGKISQKNGLARYFRSTSEGFTAAIAYRDSVLSGNQTPLVLCDPFEIYSARMRDDTIDRGFVGTQERRASIAEGRHASESQGLVLQKGDEFATSVDDIPKVLLDVMKELVRRYNGAPVGRVVTNLATKSPGLVKFAASLGIEIISPDRL